MGFFKPFNERDINEWDKKVGIPFDKYISFEDILTDEEKYVTNSDLKTDPLTIVLNKNNRIDFIEYLGMKEREIIDKIEEILVNSEIRAKARGRGSS